MGKTKDVTTETTKEVCGTIFDDVFRTIAQKMPFLLIPLINEVFQTNYPEDYAPGDFEYTEHMIAEIRFQKFHCFSVQVPVLWKNRIQTSGLPFVRRVRTDIQDDKCSLQSGEWNR